MANAASPEVVSRSAVFATARRKAWVVGGLMPLGGLAWAWALTDYEPRFRPWCSWTGFCLLATLLLVTATDLARRKIPNFITYPTAVWLFALAWLQAAGDFFASGTSTAATLHRLIGAVAPGDQLLGFLACFGIMFFVFVFAGSGGGDVKLAAVIGAAVGLSTGVMAVVATHVAAGTFALAWAVVRRGPLVVTRGFARLLGHFVFPLWVAAPAAEDRRLLHSPVPLSPFFFVGTMLAVMVAAQNRR